MAEESMLHFGGKEVPAVRVHVTGSQENWNTYLLDDGSQIRLKVVVTKIYRVKDQYDAEGNPIYTVRSTNVVDIDPADSLRRQK